MAPRRKGGYATNGEYAIVLPYFFMLAMIKIFFNRKTNFGGDAYVLKELEITN